MKTNVTFLAIALCVLVFASCTKVQLDAPQPESQSKISSTSSSAKCTPTRFSATSIQDPGYNYINFETTIDPSTGRIRSIIVGKYSGGAIDEYVSFDVVYKKKEIFLLNSGSLTDTAMTIKLNNHGYADFTTNGNAPDGSFLPTRFKYRNGLVTTRKIAFLGSELTANFYYDRNNNLILIQDVARNGEEPGRSEYKYDLTRKASNQAYFGEPRGFSVNTSILLQYMKLLPTQPVNLRTAAIVYWEDAYLVYNAKLINHVVDGTGNLVSYESSLSDDGTPTTHFDITWNCGIAAPSGDVQ